MPPHYAGYRTVPDGLTAVVAEALAAGGHRAVRFEPPLKTLAAGSGLARYGRNNVAYVPGLGSYLMLAACATDAPPPAGTPWSEPRQLARCERCTACLRACPAGAIRADRFLLQTDRCLTSTNESEAPFPDWVDPAWHHAAVGCLRCQQSCPENAARRAPRHGPRGVRRGGDGGDPRRRRRSRPRGAGETRALRARLLSHAHRAQPPRADRPLGRRAPPAPRHAPSRGRTRER